MKEPAKWLPMSRCKEGVIYEIYARRMWFGVYSKRKRGFIGIREKYNERFLFTERHWNTGSPFGTAKPVKKIGAVPDDIPLEEHLGTIDKKTRRRVEHPGGFSDWRFVGARRTSKRIQPIAVQNDELFRYLEGIEKRFLLKCRRCKQGFPPSRLSKDRHCSICLWRMKYEKKWAREGRQI